MARASASRPDRVYRVDACWAFTAVKILWVQRGQAADGSNKRVMISNPPQFLCMSEPRTTLYSPIRIFPHDAFLDSYDRIQSAGSGCLFPRNLRSANSDNSCRNATVTRKVIFCKGSCVKMAPRDVSHFSDACLCGKANEQSQEGQRGMWRADAVFDEGVRLLDSKYGVHRLPLVSRLSKG